PIDYTDSDSEKRLHFYDREGFSHAQSIGYKRRSLATKDETVLEILYWSPKDASEESIFNQMKRIYEDIHTYKDSMLYGETYQPVDQVLTYNDNTDKRNILE